MSVDVLVRGIMLGGGWIIVLVFVFRNESSRLRFKVGFNEDSFGIFSFELVEGKYCRIDFVIFLFDLFLLLIFVVNLCCWLFKLLLFVVFILLASFVLVILKISNVSFILY